MRLPGVPVGRRGAVHGGWHDPNGAAARVRAERAGAGAVQRDSERGVFDVRRSPIPGFAVAGPTPAGAVPIPRLPGGGGDYRVGPGVQLQEQLPRGRANRVRVDPVQAEPGAGAVPSPHRGPGPALERPAGTGFSQVGVGPEETVLFRARAAGGGVNSRNRF